MPCSLRGTNIEALYNPTVETNIMSEYLAETLLGNMPLVSTNKLFKSPSGLIFECSRIARAMPIKIEKTEVRLHFRIFGILNLDLLIGYPLENIFQEKPSTTHSDIPKAEHHPNIEPFKEVKLISPFISPEFPCEMKHSSPPSLEPKSCPSGNPSVVLEVVEIQRWSFTIYLLKAKTSMPWTSSYYPMLL